MFITEANFTQFDDMTFISEKGVSVILDYLYHRGSIKFAAVALSSITALGEELQKIKEQDNVKKAFVVRHSDNPLQTGSYHMTPVCIEKLGRKFNILVLDSKGAEKGYYAFYIAKKIFEILNVKPYVYLKLRQLDTFRCAVFSVRDLVKISKHPTIFEEIKDHVSTKKNISSYFIGLNSLPDSFTADIEKIPAKFDKYLLKLK